MRIPEIFLRRTIAAFRSPRARLQGDQAFARPDKSPWKAGERLIQPDLAATLERIAAQGPDEFYTGKTSELIVRYMEENDGRISRDDLARYRQLLQKVAAA